MAANPEKVREWFAKATQVRDMSDSLYNFAEALKVAIVKEADGPDGDVHNIDNTDNIDAAGTVMLSPIGGKGRKALQCHQFLSRPHPDLCHGSPPA